MQCAYNISLTKAVHTHTRAPTHTHGVCAERTENALTKQILFIKYC